MTDTEQRFQNSSAAGLTAYSAWIAAPKNSQVREQLMEAVHELRKTLSRIEIDMAMSERDENAHASIPIPSHRASQHRAVADEGDEPASVRAPRPPREGNREGGEPRRRPSGPKPTRPTDSE